MAWQDLFPLPGARIDAEEERELRLVAQARGGADWALSALVARYQPTVSRYLSRLTGSVAQSHVLAERIFRRMDQRIRGPQGGKQLRLWLLRTSTEMGLDALREPYSRGMRALSGPSGPAGLLPGKTATGPLRSRLGGLGEMTSKTSRQVLKLIWSTVDERADGADASHASRNGQAPGGEADTSDDPFPELDPREALRFKMIRAVLAELPYGDAQCLALHLIAGLNQAEVARALGITGSATRRRVVHGLQLFAMRYEAAAASLRLPPETAQERQSRIFETPTLGPEYVEQPERLSNGAVPHGDAAIPSSPPLTTEPPRIVSANPEEPIEDVSAAALSGNISAYDLADEATVVIDPIVVEADSTLPVPAPEHARAAGGSSADLWFAGDLVAILEPHLAVGSVPLGDTALTLEIVDEPLESPVVAMLQPAVIMPEGPVVEPAGAESMARDDAPEPAIDLVGDTAIDLVGDTAIGMAEDDSGELILVDLEAMTQAPLPQTETDTAVDEAPDDVNANVGGASMDDAFLLLDDALEGDELISIADAYAPEVVAVSGSGRQDDASAVSMRNDVAQMRATATDHGERPASAPEPLLASEAPSVETPAVRVPRQVPVLTETQPASFSARPAAPRRVPVLTGDDLGSSGETAKVASVAKRARVERVSHR